jgi:hypothetical protein
LIALPMVSLAGYGGAALGASSPSGSWISIGSGASITDATGNVWTIAPGGYPEINGQPAPGQGPGMNNNITKLAYINGQMFELTSNYNADRDGYWYGPDSNNNWPPYGKLGDNGPDQPTLNRIAQEPAGSAGSLSGGSGRDAPSRHRGHEDSR